MHISESCLRRWVLQADIDDNGSDTRLTSMEKRELAQLRKEKRRLEMENEVLKRAVAYFARDSILGDPALSSGSAVAQPGSVEVDVASSF